MLNHLVGRVFARALLALLAALAACCGCGSGRNAGQLSTKELLADGWEKYRFGEFRTAVKTFERVRSAAPRGSDPWLAATYGAATTWNLRRPDEDPGQARALYLQILDTAPTNDLAAWSLLALARMKALPVAGELPELNAQVVAYQEVIDRFPFHPAGEEAFLLQQGARLDQPDEARTREVMASLEEFLRTHPQSPWQSTVYSLVGHCCDVLGLGEKHLEAALQAKKSAATDPDSLSRDQSWMYWQIATLAEFEAGDFTIAREYYRKLIEEYPTEQRVFLAKQELERMDALEARILREGVEQ